MAGRRRGAWSLWLNAVAIAAESAAVIPLRLAKIAHGGTAGKREATRMVDEKVAAGMAAARTLATGGSATAVARQVRRKVRSNRKRLSK